MSNFEIRPRGGMPRGGRNRTFAGWIPFGGGRRRCIGASFAMLEMKVVLRTLLSTCELHDCGEGVEVAQRRNITVCPAQGARVVLGERERMAVS
ncbi:MAG: cytochrome P450 [Actinomycetota bacterium]|nr:cytochrome P450 [Actinomycetota bacterium]